MVLGKVGGQQPTLQSEQGTQALPCRAFVDKGLGIEVVYIWVPPVDQAREPGSTLPHTPLHTSRLQHSLRAGITVEQKSWLRRRGARKRAQRLYKYKHSLGS